MHLRRLGRGEHCAMSQVTISSQKIVSKVGVCTVAVAIPLGI
jgi:hypothetical protein